jgi:hypothetical protein
MRNFELFADHETEDQFRGAYGSWMSSHKMRCCSGLLEEDWCENTCNFLIAGGDVDYEGFPPIFGIDCDVDILCWGGDIDDVTAEVYCSKCAALAWKDRFIREREEELRSIERAEARRAQQMEIEERNRKQIGFWNDLSPLQFENQCACLFQQRGYDVRLTAFTNDGGIDIHLSKDEKRGAAQCKAWQGPCGVKELRQFFGVICAEHLDFGFFIAKSGYTNSARDFLRKAPTITAWDMKNLVEEANRPDS